MTALALIGLAGCWLLLACLLIMPVALFCGVGSRHDDELEKLSREHTEWLGPVSPNELNRSHSPEIVDAPQQ